MTSVRVRVGCEFIQRAQWPVHTIVQVEPRPDGDFDVVDAGWDPRTPPFSSTYRDVYGNLVRRTDLPAGESVLRFDATVEVPDEVDASDGSAPEVLVAELPDDTLQFTLPSRYCPSDVLAPVARELFGGLAPGWGRVQAINDWCHTEIAFGYGASTSLTTAVDVYEARRGVCRDFAHLAVTFCRALAIPARYVFGYLPDIGVPPPDEPMDFCAWTEVYLGDRWWTFDPRVNQRRVGRVLIGRGRDALDVAMVSSFGPVDLESMVVWADEVTA
jgi:transglutaminase-like putative cysteine protease